jgi:photosystem II stability/assembly factor-like uncharacterized protein
MILFVGEVGAGEGRNEALHGPFDGLEYRLIGPAAGGRVSRAVGVPGDPRTFWAATSAGGVWKSVNGGLEWKSVFDDQPVSSIGSIAVAPSDPDVVWVGSGEANIRGDVGEGNGIYRSGDAGATWKRVWSAEGQIGTIIAHPKDPDVAFAAVLGSPFGPGEDRGVLRTTDGGRTWKKVLYVDADTGASDVCFDPSDPRILFAGTWQARRPPWDLISGGPGGGLWTSRDGGDSWKRLTGEGLPDGIWGKVGVRVATSDPRRVYALIEAEEGGLFHSANGGKIWERVNRSRGLRQRPWFFSTLTIDPYDADVVWFPQFILLKTMDGGRSVRTVTGDGWDYHDVWIDPTDPAQIIVASDAGVSLSRDGGATWTRPPLPISQFYHISVDTRLPYHVLGSLQDLGTVSAPSNSLHGGGILLSDWREVGGGEYGYVVADSSDPEIVWAGDLMGVVARFDGRTRQAPNVAIYPENSSGRPASEMRYRFQWTAPVVISPHDPKIVYHAANVLFKTEDDGQSWQAISPDLTRDDATKQGWAGGPITGDNTGVEYYNTIFAVAESPVKRGLIWVGTDDGLVHLTRDGGKSWNDVTPDDIPEWGTVSGIEASRWDAGVAYVVVDAHRLDDESPYLWKTSDYGASWQRLGRDLGPEVYLHVVREDTRVRGMLYLGTERGVLMSPDDGSTWLSLRLNMPTVAIADLVVAGDDLVVATHGRSAWILDDLTPVREMPEVIGKEANLLFPPRPAIRWYIPSDWSSPRGSRDGAGENPPAGAIVTYYLAQEPERPITLEVLDVAGRRVRTLTSELEPIYTSEDHPDWDPLNGTPQPALTTRPGLNRASWDLTHHGSRWVAGSRLDTGGPGRGARVVPGDYTLKLTVGGNTSTQALRVEPDPRSSASLEDIESQVEFCLEVRDEMSRIADQVETLRAVRTQIEGYTASLGDAPAASSYVELGKTLAAQLTAIEEKLHNPHAEVDYDVLAGRHGGAKLVSRFGWLLSGSLEHDGPPTQGMTEIAAELERETAETLAALQQLLTDELAQLNALAAELEIPDVRITEPAPS